MVTAMRETGELAFELVKRDGRREEYDRAKLARSLLRAGVSPQTIRGTLDRVEPRPGQHTGLLRLRVVSELERSHPTAARRYASTRSLIAIACEQAGFGWVCVNPQTLSRIGLKPGSTAWLSDSGTPAAFSIENREEVKQEQAWLNPREMAMMGVTNGTRLTAAGMYPEIPTTPEQSWWSQSAITSGYR